LPQFDFLTLSTQTLSFLTGLFVLYYNNVNIGLLYFVKTKKARSKKVKRTIKQIVRTGPNLKTMRWASDINYQFYLRSKLGDITQFGRVYALQA
jgi:hypothetical protein